MSPPVAVGVDVGGTKVLGLLVGADGEQQAELQVPTPAEGEALLDAVADVVLELAGKSADDPLCGVGVGMPGLVAAAGVLEFAPNLPLVVGLDVVEGLRQRLSAGGLSRPHSAGVLSPLLSAGGRPDTLLVHAENDANCAGAAEHAFGVAAAAPSALVVTLGTGIGGAFYVDGRLVRGANNFAGEIGHMTFALDGLPCPCGKSGCWERYASGSALGRMAREVAAAGKAGALLALAGGVVENLRGEHVLEAAGDGDTVALGIFAALGYYLALGLANLVGILDPDMIVIGGGLARAGEVLLGPTRDAFAELLEGAAHRPVPAIVRARFAELAGAMGAAALAFDRAGVDHGVT